MRLERWQTNLYTLWVTQIFSMVGFGMALPFIPYYIQEMGVTDPERLSFLTGLSSTLPAATMAIFSPIWGKVSDVYGRKMMLMRAMFCSTFILISYGFTHTVGVFMVLRAVHGVFTGTVGAALTFVSANTPSNRLSYALGFLTSSNFLGYALGPVLGGFLAETVGYRNCFFIGAAVMFTGFLLVLALLKEDKSTYGKRLPAEGGEENEKKTGSGVLTKFTVLMLVILVVLRVTRSIFSPFAPLFVQDRLGTVVGAPRYTGFINAASGIGTALASVTLARLGDKYDKYKLMTVLTAMGFFMSLTLLPKYPLLLFCVVYALYFFICGAIEPILTSCVSEKVDPSHRGTLFGIIGMMSSIALMISPMLGTGISVKFSFEAILYAIPVLTLVQLTVLFAGRKLATKEKE